ncbi:MAG TPA: hypothetical protein VEW45_00355 [Candidatus Dormibacteraeota bacterium]|nr:hypothetical protein [Candidatus Dormibacteraeota bacterium]
MNGSSLAARLESPATVRAAGLLALGAFLYLLLAGRSIDLLGSPSRMGLVLAWAAVAAAFWLTGRASVVVAYLVIGGLLMRWVELPAGGAGPSDVLAAINEAIAVWFGGGNPYDHFYEATRPAGQPMPYPPGALLVHLPGYAASGLAGVQLTEFVLAGVAMVALAALGTTVSWLAALPALAIYAGASNLVLLATDGSNDTGVGALVLIAIIALGWSIDHGLDDASLMLAGIWAALAVSSKQIALPLVLVLAIYLVRRHGWRPARRYLAAAGAILLLISIPFLLQGPVTYVEGLFRFVGVHEDIYGWNIWAFAQGMGWTPWDQGPATILNVVVSAIALLALLVLPLRRPSGALLAGVAALLVVLLSARWTTYAYFALLAPVVLALPAVAIWEARRSAEAIPS